MASASDMRVAAAMMDRYPFRVREYPPWTGNCERERDLMDACYLAVANFKARAPNTYSWYLEHLRPACVAEGIVSAMLDPECWRKLQGADAGFVVAP